MNKFVLGSFFNFNACLEDNPLSYGDVNFSQVYNSYVTFDEKICIKICAFPLKCNRIGLWQNDILNAKPTFNFIH